ncbi:MAG: hypothetical protein ACREFP_25625 [Acetobacteraceae bacterium]
MARGRKPQGSQPLSGAERQARYRERHAHAPVIRYPKPADRRSRRQRWHDAVAELVALQAEYAQWFDALLEPFRDTATGEAPQAIVGLDLNEICAIEPPRGFAQVYPGDDGASDSQPQHSNSRQSSPESPATPRRLVPPDSLQSLREARVPSVDSGDDPHPRKPNPQSKGPVFNVGKGPVSYVAQQGALKWPPNLS